MSNRDALIVDDHPTNRLLASAMLRKLGWSVQEADSGEAGLQLAGKHAFRLVLLDISMPGLSGEETCRQLRQLYDDKPLYILAYTAHAFPEDRERILAAGFDDMLVKPISRQRLEAMLQHL